MTLRSGLFVIRRLPALPLNPPPSLPDAPATLQVREMERILDFLQVKVVGQGPMTHAKCVEYWGSDVDVCKEIKD